MRDRTMTEWPTPKTAPRTEPEIIPPGADSRATSRIWVASDSYGARRIYSARLGPVGLILLALAIGTLSVMTLVLLLGALLIWVPIVGLVVAASIISGIFRRPPRGFR